MKFKQLNEIGKKYDAVGERNANERYGEIKSQPDPRAIIQQIIQDMDWIIQSTTTYGDDDISEARLTGRQDLARDVKQDLEKILPYL